MNQQIYKFIYVYHYAAITTFCGVATILSMFFFLAGAFETTALPAGFTTRTELIGLLLMLIILPAYLGMGTILGQRRSLQLAQTSQQGSDFEFAQQIASVPFSYTTIGMVLGFAYSFLNLPNAGIESFSSGEKVLAALTMGQILLWTAAGLTLSIRIHVARIFYLAGKQVQLDVFEMSNLKPFGHAGLTDVLLVAVAMAITTLQSLDAQFRMYNYINALTITIPALTVLMVSPMYSLHRRIVSVRNEELRKVNDLIRSAPKDLVAEHVSQLELYLQRRQRLLLMHTWPLDMTVASRLLLYVIVPPLAWLGAAFVEIVLNSFLTTS